MKRFLIEVVVVLPDALGIRQLDSANVAKLGEGNQGIWEDVECWMSDEEPNPCTVCNHLTLHPESIIEHRSLNSERPVRSKRGRVVVAMNDLGFSA